MQLCVPSASNDTAAIAKGETVNLSFTASEPLLVDPIVKFVSNGVERDFARVSVTGGDTPVYVSAYTTGGDEKEGARQVTAAITDVAGNSNTVDMPTLIIDFTPP